MKNLAGSPFGHLIAYLIPGYAVLLAASRHSATLQTWLGATLDESATVGGFLFVTLAAVAIGLVASTIRWLVIDSLHHRTGLSIPIFDFRQLEQKLAAFEFLNEAHYRYYQAYGNGLVALVYCYADFRCSADAPPVGWFDGAAVLLATLLAVGSRDTLRKFYLRSEQLLRSSSSMQGQGRLIRVGDASPQFRRGPRIR